MSDDTTTPELYLSDEIQARGRLVAALARVMGALPAIPKTGTAPEKMGSYAFRTIEDVVGALQPLLATEGLVLVPTVNLANSYATGERTTETVLEVDWEILHKDGGRITARTIGVGRDQYDKGAPKATTGAYKALLLTLFAVAGAGEDPEASDLSERPAKASTTKRRSSGSGPTSARKALEVEAGPPDPHRVELIDRARDMRRDLRLGSDAFVPLMRDSAGGREVKALDGLSTEELESLVAVLDDLMASTPQAP